ncbi:hypothetical protein AB4Y67_17300 [Arthrobacter sp. YAF17]|uniref:hypothetical protein n=1 Tax=Arthrobacter sp. YAF17 TaxID=3233077 RepID=UPI003F931FC1
MSETPDPAERRHSEAPAEGDPTADVSEIRVHSEDPAEGADFDDAAPNTPRSPGTASGDREG